MSSHSLSEYDSVAEFSAKDPIETCVLWLLEGLEKPMSAAALRASVARLPGPWTFEEAIEALESFGFRCRERSISLSDLLSTHKTSIFLSEGAVVAAIQPKNEAHPAQLFVPTRNLRPTALSVENLAMIYGGVVIEIETDLKLNSTDENQQGRFGHWFFGPLLTSKFIYFQVVMAAFLTNIFALATSVFSMIVYDRVMPNGAMETLVALLVGVFIIFVSDFVIRTLRSYFLDVAGAQADMGFTLPASIGAAVASEGLRDVIGITGDGSFQMNIQELQTIVNYKLPIKIFILNNGGYLSIRNTMDKFFESRYFGTDAASGLALPNSKKIANAYDIPYYSIRNMDDINNTLDLILNTPGYSITEVFCLFKQDIIPSSSTKEDENGKLYSPPLEYMFPFLSDEEFKNEMIIKPI